MAFSVERSLELLEGAHAQNRLAHAYLITGPEGSGKRELAARLITRVNAMPAAGAAEAPALESLRGEYVTLIRPESRSRRITADAMREAEKALYRAAPAQVTKFGVIVEADRMNVAAENAFLKTLEEPPGRSILLLLTAQPEQLLETILSRCIRIPLFGRGMDLAAGEHTATLLKAISRYFADGRGGVSGALGIMSIFSSVLKEEKAAIADRHEARLKADTKRYQKTTEGDWLKRREEFYKALTESQYLERRTRLIETLVAWFGDALRQKHGSPHLDLPGYAEATRALAEKLSARELSQKADAIERLRTHLNTNVHETLALEAGFIRAFG